MMLGMLPRSAANIQEHHLYMVAAHVPGAWRIEALRPFTGKCSSMDASAGNRARVTSMATMYSTTRPLMQAREHMKAKI